MGSRSAETVPPHSCRALPRSPARLPRRPPAARHGQPGSGAHTAGPLQCDFYAMHEKSLTGLPLVPRSPVTKLGLCQMTSGCHPWGLGHNEPPRPMLIPLAHPPPHALAIVVTPHNTRTTGPLLMLPLPLESPALSQCGVTSPERPSCPPLNWPAPVSCSVPCSVLCGTAPDCGHFPRCSLLLWLFASTGMDLLLASPFWPSAVLGPGWKPSHQVTE